MIQAILVSVRPPRRGPRSAAAARPRRRLATAVAAALALALAVAALTLGLAPQAAAQAITYEVTGIRVDVTADNAAAARDKALQAGARQALQQFVERHVPAEKRSRYARMSQQQIEDMISDFSIRDEKTSAVRYIATLDYRFKPSRASRLLRDSGVVTGEPGVPLPPLIVVPVVDGSIAGPAGGDAWRSAWRSIAERRGGGRYVVAAAADAGSAGDQAQLAALVRRLGGDSALVAIATPGSAAADGTPQTIDVRFYRQGRSRQASGSASYAIADGETADAFVRRVAAAADGAQAQAWKNAAQTAPVTRAQVDVYVPVDDLADWLAMQKTLRQVEGVRQVQLLMMARREMFVGLAYAGSFAQLQQNLEDADLALVQADGRHVLTRDTSPIAPIDEPAAAADPGRAAAGNGTDSGRKTP